MRNEAKNRGLLGGLFGARQNPDTNTSHDVKSKSHELAVSYDNAFNAFTTAFPALEQDIRYDTVQNTYTFEPIENQLKILTNLLTPEFTAALEKYTSEKETDPEVAEFYTTHKARLEQAKVHVTRAMTEMTSHLENVGDLNSEQADRLLQVFQILGLRRGTLITDQMARA